MLVEGRGANMKIGDFTAGILLMEFELDSTCSPSLPFFGCSFFDPEVSDIWCQMCRTVRI